MCAYFLKFDEGNCAKESLNDLSQDEEVRFCLRQYGGSYFSSYYRNKYCLNKSIACDMNILSHSLLNLSSLHQLNARKVSSLLGRFMESKLQNDSQYIEIARQVIIIGLAMSIDNAADEIYAQLIKQTTGNPRIESTYKGYHLMLMCLSAFPPSKLVESVLSFVLCHLARNPTASIAIRDIAQRCYDALSNIVVLGKRADVPSMTELYSIMTQQSFDVEVFLADGSAVLCCIDSWCTCGELAKQVKELLQVNYHAAYSLYIQKSAGVERCLNDKEGVMHCGIAPSSKAQVNWYSFASKLEKMVQRLRGKGSKLVSGGYESTRLVFKIRHYLNFNWTPTISSYTLDFIYFQVVEDVLKGVIKTTVKEMECLIALMCQVRYGSCLGESTSLYAKIELILSELKYRTKFHPLEKITSRSNLNTTPTTRVIPASSHESPPSYNPEYCNTNTRQECCSEFPSIVAIFWYWQQLPLTMSRKEAIALYLERVTRVTDFGVQQFKVSMLDNTSTLFRNEDMTAKKAVAKNQLQHHKLSVPLQKHEMVLSIDRKGISLSNGRSERYLLILSAYYMTIIMCCAV